MMTENEAIELGRRAVACKRWRWLPGMRDMSVGARALLRPSGSGIEWIVDGYPSITPLKNGMVPDLRDPCTRGGLLELVREAWGDVDIYIGRAANGWYPSSRTADMRGVYGYDSEVEALVSALEAAP